MDMDSKFRKLRKMTITVKNKVVRNNQIIGNKVPRNQKNYMKQTFRSSNHYTI